MLLNMTNRGVLPGLFLCWAVISSMPRVAAADQAILIGNRQRLQAWCGNAAQLTIHHKDLNRSSAVSLDGVPIALESDGDTTVSLELRQSPMICEVQFTCKGQTSPRVTRLLLLAGHQHYLTLNPYKDAPGAKKDTNGVCPTDAKNGGHVSETASASDEDQSGESPVAAICRQPTLAEFIETLQQQQVEQEAVLKRSDERFRKRQRAYDEHLEEAKEFDAVITTLEKEQEWWRSQERGRRPLYPTRIRQTVEAELHAANNASRKHHDESGVLEQQLREAEAELNRLDSPWVKLQPCCNWPATSPIRHISRLTEMCLGGGRPFPRGQLLVGGSKVLRLF